MRGASVGGTHWPSIRSTVEPVLLEPRCGVGLLQALGGLVTGPPKMAVENTLTMNPLGWVAVPFPQVMRPRWMRAAIDVWSSAKGVLGPAPQYR